MASIEYVDIYKYISHNVIRTRKPNHFIDVFFFFFRRRGEKKALPVPVAGAGGSRHHGRTDALALTAFGPQLSQRGDRRRGVTAWGCYGAIAAAENLVPL